MNGILQGRVLHFGLAGASLTLAMGCSPADPLLDNANPLPENSAYKVERMDTVDRIAYEFGIEVADLQRENPGLSRTEPLQQGSSLKIPSPPDPQPVVPTLKPDVPESSAYSGTFNLILEMSDGEVSWLKEYDELGKDFARPAQPQTAEITEVEVSKWLSATAAGTYSQELFADDLHWIDTASEIAMASAEIKKIPADMALAQLKAGKRIRITRNADGSAYEHRFVRSFEPRVHTPPRLLFVEHYRLTNFVSDYGTGRIIKTFSLMPGEKAELTVSSFTRQTLKETEASSILDSYSNETLAEFENSVREEQSSRDASTSTTAVKASASASASWGWGKAKASGSYANATSEARTSFASNVASATAKNTARASAARNVEINTNVERSVEEEKKEISVRTVENINSSRTLNFIFYQMNQRYVSLLHLTEIELGYDDGRGNLVVVPLYEMRPLLEQVIRSDKVDDAANAVNEALAEIRDYRGHKRPGFIAEDSWLTIGSPEEPANALNVSEASKVHYSRVDHNYVSSYEELSSGREFFVEGIVVAAQPLVLRTDGVYVESLLGQSSAWSPHTEKIKAEELRELQLKNDRLKKGL